MSVEHNPGSATHRRKDVQGLRAIAVLGVIAFHAGLPLPGGFAGVDIFFVISGFVITGMLLRAHATEGSVNLRRFYAARFKRLIPALGLMVAVTVLAGVVLLSPFGMQQVTAKTAAGAMLFGANLVIDRISGGYFDPAATANPLLHTWSLSVEEQFYFVFPVAFLLLLRLGRRALPWALALGGVGSFLLSFAGPAFPLGFYGPVTRAWEFTAGALIALTAARWRGLSPRASALLGVIGLAVVGLALILLQEGAHWPGLPTLLPVLGTSLLLVSGCGGERGVVARLLSSPAMVTIGDYSYSLYLWHWPVIVFALALWPSGGWVPVLAAAVSVIPAVLSYRLVEQRFRYARLAGLRAWLPAIALASVVPVALAAGLYVGATKSWGIQSVKEDAAASQINHLGWDDCLDLETGGDGLGRVDPAKCTFNASATGLPIYLVGDSNAAQYSEPLLEVARQQGRPLIVRTAASCPFMDVYRSSDGVRDTSDRKCRSTYEQTMALLRQAPRGASVFIGEAASHWTLPGRGYSRRDEVGSERFSDRRRVLAEGLRSTVTTVQQAGLQPIVIEPSVVNFSDARTPTVTACTSTLELWLGRCPTPVPLAQATPEARELRESVRALAHELAVPYVPVVSVQCPRGMCQPRVQGRLVFMDEHHYTAAFTRLLTGDFLRAIKLDKSH